MLTVHFDGSCEPCNPGGTCAGAWVISRDGSELARGYAVFYKRGDPLSTNNAAEWCACGRGIRDALDLLQSGESLEIVGDSALVVNQLNRVWGAKNERMIAFRDRCWELLRGVEWRARWVPREENSLCDSLSRGEGR